MVKTRTLPNKLVATLKQRIQEFLLIQLYKKVFKGICLIYQHTICIAHQYHSIFMETLGQNIERDVLKETVTFEHFQFGQTSNPEKRFRDKINQSMVHAFFEHLVEKLQYRVI